jgi:hypothetical protein
MWSGSYERVVARWSLKENTDLGFVILSEDAASRQRSGGAVEGSLSTILANETSGNIS